MSPAKRGWQHCVIEYCCLRVQAISVYRAMLSERYVPGNIDETDDQNILLADDVTPDLVPSNGYTYDRIPSQVRCGSGSGPAPGF